MSVSPCWICLERWLELHKSLEYFREGSSHCSFHSTCDINSDQICSRCRDSRCQGGAHLHMFVFAFSSPSHFQGYGSEDNVQWSYGNVLLGRELKVIFFKVLDSPLSWTQQIQLLHSETLRVGAQRPESSEVPPLFAFPWCMRRDDVHSPVLSNSAFGTWTLCRQDRIKITLNWTAKGS